MSNDPSLPRFQSLFGRTLFEMMEAQQAGYVPSPVEDSIEYLSRQLSLPVGAELFSLSGEFPFLSHHFSFFISKIEFLFSRGPKRNRRNHTSLRPGSDAKLDQFLQKPPLHLRFFDLHFELSSSTSFARFFLQCDREGAKGFGRNTTNLSFSP